MSNSSLPITSSGLLASATQFLESGGYQQIRETFRAWDTSTTRLFEDAYNVVGVTVFESCSELFANWPESQDSLVNVISKQIGRVESKSWDGYLVLLTPGLDPGDGTKIESIRYNTTRLRKLIATGDDLRSLTDVERVLRPLLPLGDEQGRLTQESSLDALPRLLAEQGIPEETTRLLVDAFCEQSPMLQRLHQQRNKE